MLIVVLFLVLIVTLVLLVKGSASFMGRILGKMVYEKHHLAETIVNEGRVPKVWLNVYGSKFDRIKIGLVDKKRLRKLEAKAKKKILQKLDRLIAHFKKSPLVQDKEARQILISRLEEARRTWEQKNWVELSALAEDV